MSGEVFLDTNILIYASLRDDPRAAIAAALLAAGGVISVQVLNEFASVAHRKLKRPWSEVTTALTAFRTLCPEVRALDLATHEAALAIAQRDVLSLYDALIVASALEAGCVRLLTEDMQDGRIIARRLTISNPFAAV
jgi:predicted nucleic acid-binding protein